MMEQPARSVGRVINCSSTTGEAELSESVEAGQLVYFTDARTKNPVLCRVTAVRASTLSGLVGRFRIVDKSKLVPKAYTMLYRYVAQPQTGVFLEVGSDQSGEPVRVRLNAVFGHVLVGGKTRSGKTKLTIKLAQELVGKRVPHLIIDPQGEHVGLAQFDSHVDIFDNDPASKVLRSLKHHRTVVLNLLGMKEVDKERRVVEVLSALQSAKEQDYTAALNGKTLEFPPVIVTVDEAEIFAPARRFRLAFGESRDLLIDIAKRMAKMGIGLVCVAQRFYRLDVDVRSQCNSAFVFNTDYSALNVLRTFNFITEYDLGKVSTLTHDECLMVGSMVHRPEVLRIGQIATPRPKPTDFEDMLGLRKEQIEGGKIDDTEGFQATDRMLCGGCGSETVPRQTDEGGSQHIHMACEKCGDEYCPQKERWVKSAD